MVKISDFLSTDQQVAIQQNTQPQEAVKQLSGQSLQAEGQYVNNQLNKAASENAKAKADALQAQQLKMQEKYQLNNIFGNLQEVQLKTLSTLSAIDEQNRKQQENTAASSNVLNVGVQYELQAKQKMNEIISKSKEDGSDILPAFSDWHNQFFIDAENNAPNPLAIASLKNMNASNMAKFGGVAIDKAQERRVNTSIKNVSETANIVSQNAYDDPSYDIQPDMQAMRAVLESANQDPVKVDETMGKIAANLYSSKIDGLVAQLDFGAAKSLLTQPEANKLLTPDQRSNAYEHVINAQQKYLEIQHEQTRVANAAVQWGKGNLTEFDSKLLGDKEKEQLAVMISNKIDTVLTSQTDNGMKTGQVADILKSSTWHPSEVYTYLSDKIKTGSFEEKVVVANAINQVSRDKQSYPLISNIDKDMFVEATLIASNSMHMSAEDAVVQAQNLTRRKDAGGDIAILNDKLSSITSKNIAEKAGVVGWFKGTFTSTPDSPQMYAEFNEIAKLAYRKGYTADQAIQIGYKYVGALHSVTAINGEKEVVQMAPEMVFAGDSMDVFNQTVNAKKDEMAARLGYTLSEDKKSYSININGNTITSPIKILPVQDVTYFQHKEGSPITTWQIVDGRDGYEWRNYETFIVDTSPKLEEARIKNQEQQKAFNDTMDRLKKDNESFKTLMVQEKGGMTFTGTITTGTNKQELSNGK